MSNLSQRLKSARVMNGLTLESLSSKMAHAVSKQALQQYESGVRNPSLEVLREISKALNLKPEYFLRENTVSLGVFKFRKQSKLGPKWQEALTEKVRDALERYLELEEILNARQSFQNPLKLPVVTNDSEAEAAAQAFREHFNLGSDPVHNILEMLESIGIKVIMIDEVPEFSGVSTVAEDLQPVIVLNKKLLVPSDSEEKPKHDRLRFTALHELAHLVLKIDDCDEKQEEKLCHAFAGAFLLPQDRIDEHFGPMHRNRIYLRELLNVKETFGISIRAILMRLRRLDRISEYDLKNFFVLLNREYGAKSEPGDCPSVEKPFRFEQLLYRALAEDLITMSKAAELQGMRLADFREAFAKKV